MDIDAAQLRHIQHLLGQDAAVGHHRANIRPQGPQLLHVRLRPEILGLKHRKMRGQSHLLHRRSHQLHPPSLGPIRLGIDADYLKSVG